MELDQCDKHHKDLYYGDENHPGITTGLLLVEKTTAAIVSYGRWILLLLGGVLVTSIMHLVVK